MVHATVPQPEKAASHPASAVSTGACDALDSWRWAWSPGRPPATSPPPPPEIAARRSVLGPAARPGIPPAEYLERHAETHGLDEDHELVLEAVLRGVTPGSEVHRYAHRHRGVTVEAEGLALIVREGLVTGVAGTVTVDIDAALEPALSAEEAVGIALDAAPEGVRFARDGHQCELRLRRHEEAWTLRHDCALVGATPGHEHLARIDADTGELLALTPYRRRNLPGYELAPASVVTGWHGVRPVQVYRHIDSNTYFLQDSSLQVLDGASNAAVYPAPPDGTPVPFTSTTGLFDSSQAAGGAALWGAQQTLDHLSSTWGIQVDDVRVISNLTGWGNGQYDPATGEIWLGTDEMQPSQWVDLTTVDTVAHELAHLTLARLGMVPATPLWGFHAAMEESFADILGELVEAHALGTADWVHNLDYAPLGGGFRSLTQPTISDPAQPDVLGGANNQPHHDAGIVSLWFTRLAGIAPSSGTTSNQTVFEIDPLDTERAFRLLVRTLELMPTNGVAGQAYSSSVKAAEEACGAASREVVAVHDAWHSVEVVTNPVTTSPYSSPADNELGVHPWPARISWQADIGATQENEWELQISPDVFFPPASTQTHITSNLDVENGKNVGWIELTLEPEETYYWRIRPLFADPAFACWRPTKQFTTGDAAPQPFYPNGNDVHPWAITFSYSQADGAKTYEIEVSDDGNVISDPDPAKDGRFAKTIFPPQLIPAQEDSDQTARITVPKLSELVWHVRAIHQANDGSPLYSGWSPPMHFQTSEPTIVLTGPTGGNPLYPWPILLQWSPLEGAEFAVKGKIIGSHAAPPRVEGLTDHWLVWYQDAFDMWTAGSPGFEWWVTGKGPPLGSELTPEPDETREDAVAAAPWTVYIDGDATEPQVQASPAPGCVDWGEKVELQWPPVPKATHYLLEDLAASDGVGPVPTDATTAVFHAKPKDSPVARVRAATPNEHLDGGLARGWAAELEYKIRASKPTIVAIYPDASDPDEIDYDWVADYSWFDGWHVEVYEGDGCQSGNGILTIQDTYPPDSPGGTFFGAMLQGLGPGTYSMKLRGASPPGCSSGAWSNCGSFEIEEPEPEPDPVAPTVSCGETISFSGGNEPPFSYVLDFGGEASGQVQLSYDYFCVPDNVYVKSPYGNLVTTSGCTGTGTTNTIPADYDPSTHQVDGNCVHSTQTEPWASFSNVSYLVIDVYPNCFGLTNTLWEFTIDCQLDP